MKAYITNDSRVICPYCTNDQFLVVRRELGDGNTVVKKCRCQACGDRFEYAENKEGQPVNA